MPDINHRESLLAALWLSGDLTPPDDLAERVARELAAIRSTFADVLDPHGGLPDLPGLPKRQPSRFIPPWEVGTVALAFTDDAAEAVEAGIYSGWRGVNEEFGITSVDVTEGGRSAWVHTDRLLHPTRMAEKYRSLPGVISAEPVRPGGEISQIYPRMTGADITYLFCSVFRDETYPGSPVLHRTFRYFVFDGDTPRLAGVRDTEREGMEPPAWWEEAGENFWFT